MIAYICGMAAGIITGFGIGGGLILIVLLDILTNFTQLEIQSINLIYYIPTAIFSLWIYSKEKNVNYKIGIKFVFVGLLTAIVGAKIAHSIDINLLRKFFAIYLIIIGTHLLVKTVKRHEISIV